MADPTSFTIKNLSDFLAKLKTRGIGEGTPLHFHHIDRRDGREKTFDRFFNGGSCDILSEHPTVIVRVVERE